MQGEQIGTYRVLWRLGDCRYGSIFAGRAPSREKPLVLVSIKPGPHLRHYSQIQQAVSRGVLWGLPWLGESKISARTFEEIEGGGALLALEILDSEPLSEQFSTDAQFQLETLLVMILFGRWHEQDHAAGSSRRLMAAPPDSTDDWAQPPVSTARSRAADKQTPLADLESITPSAMDHPVGRIIIAGMICIFLAVIVLGTLLAR